ARGIAAGAPLVMTAHIIFPALDASRPATLSPIILDDILRGELGFTGAVISDSMNMKSMRSNYEPIDAATQAINAGVDIVMLAEEHYDHDSSYLERQVALIEGIRAAVREGHISEARLDEAVGRVLTLKAGLEDASLDPGSVGSDAHRAVELEAARAAISVVRGSLELMPSRPGAPITIVNTSLRSAYDILGSTRGIGPNQTDAAFDLFVDAVRQRSPQAHILSAEHVLDGKRPTHDGLVVAVTENHPLPGVDFDQSAKHDVLRALIAGGHLVQVIALRDPYELRDMPFVHDYVCAFGSRWCSAVAAVELLFGEIAGQGASPVSVPGAGIEAR
ncbi:MAG: glycoside hydrolase family 3 N-terminal domain-containing protein, partial [Chloroflexota bacterium]